MSRHRWRIFALLTVLLFVLASGQAAPLAGPAPFESRYRSMTWDDIVAEARGQDVFLYMWGGSSRINTYINDYVARVMRILYNINVRQVPLTDTVEAVNKVLGEKQAGKVAGGAVDLVWINGENFRTAREARILFGPWSDLIPNRQYIDWEDPAVAFDFGYPVEFHESPWGAAQFVMEYDSAKVPNPPTTIDALLKWAKDNPGRFTYPAPPDFTGSVFVRHVFYWAAGGPRRLLGPFSDSVYQEVAPKVWKALQDLKPSLWRRGETYPEGITKQVDMLSNGEVWFSMRYGPGHAASRILTGGYPRSIRTYVFDTGTIGNTNYLAIPFNSTHKAAAMVLANFMISLDAQYEAVKPDVLGWLTPLSPTKVPGSWLAKFKALPRHEATLPAEVLNAKKLPELQATWLVRIEKDWVTNVLQR